MMTKAPKGDSSQPYYKEMEEYLNVLIAVLSDESRLALSLRAIRNTNRGKDGKCVVGPEALLIWKGIQRQWRYS
jgi:hypothetical protein